MPKPVLDSKMLEHGSLVHDAPSVIVHFQKYMRTHIDRHIYIYTYILVICIYFHVYINTYVCNICVHTHIHIYIYVSISVFLYLFIYLCVI